MFSIAHRSFNSQTEMFRRLKLFWKIENKQLNVLLERTRYEVQPNNDRDKLNS